MAPGSTIRLNLLQAKDTNSYRAIIQEFTALLHISSSWDKNPHSMGQREDHNDNYRKYIRKISGIKSLKSEHITESYVINSGENSNFAH